MINYSGIGLDSRLNNENSVLAKDAGYVSSYDFRSLYEVGATKIRASQLSVTNLVKNSSTSEASGTFGSGTGLTITASLTPTNTFSTQKLLGVPEFSVYQGTAAVPAYQIFPGVGGSITATEYTIWSGFDWQDSTGVNHSFNIRINNISAGNVSIYVTGRWRYIQDNDGLSTN